MVTRAFRINMFLPGKHLALIGADSSWRVSWGGLPIKIRQWDLPRGQFIPCTVFSAACNAVWQPFIHSRTFSKLDSVISNLATVFPNKFLEHSKSSAIISTVFIASSLAIDPTARKQFCFVYLCFFSPSSIKVLSYDYRNLFAASSSFAMPTTYAVTPFPEVLNPWEEPLRAGTTLLHGPLTCCYFSLIQWIWSRHLGWWIVSERLSIYPEPSENHYYTHILYRKYFLSNKP